MNVDWTVPRAFSVSIDNDHMIFLFRVLIWWITLIDCQILNQPCILRITPNWLFYNCWIWFSNMLLRIFASIIVRDNSFVVYLSCYIFAFGFRVVLASRNNLGSILSASIFLEVLLENCYYFFLKYLVEFTLGALCS